MIISSEHSHELNNGAVIPVPYLRAHNTVTVTKSTKTKTTKTKTTV